MRTETLAADEPGSAPLPERVAGRFGVADEAFTRLDDHGSTATWMSPSWVLQRRPAAERARIGIARRLAADNPGHPALVGCRYHALTLLEPPVTGDGEPDAFWTLQERLAGHCPSVDTTIADDRLLELAERMIPEAVRQLGELGRIPVPREAWTVPPGRGAALRFASEEIVLAHATGIDPRAGALVAHRLGPELRSEVVLAHGDPIMANQVLRDADAPLIDWETIGPLPRHADLTHIASHLCRCLTPERWEEASDLVGEIAAPALGWDARTWRRAVLWQIVRDLVAYPSRRGHLAEVARLAARR